MDKVFWPRNTDVWREFILLSYLGWTLDRIIFFEGGGVGGGSNPKMLEIRVSDRIILFLPINIGVLAIQWFYPI